MSVPSLVPFSVTDGILYGVKRALHFIKISVLVNIRVKLERLIRIELTLIAWKAIVLPLNYRRDSCTIMDQELFFFKDPFALVQKEGIPHNRPHCTGSSTG